MCCFTGSVIVEHPWSKLGLSALLKGTSAGFSPCQLVFLSQSLTKPFVIKNDIVDLYLTVVINGVFFVFFQVLRSLGKAPL
jgi:hypothetical protein